MKQPLISIIILSYKNYQYLYEALNSTIAQDYQNIELVITNDGSDDFNEQEVKKYLDKNKGSNIKKVIINNNKKNLGTVKSLNKAIKLSHGEYLVAFAADDIFYNINVVTKFVDSFNQLSNDEYLVTSQLAMYDVDLKKLIALFVSKQNIKLIKKLNPKQLFNRMATQCMIAAAGTCYKRSIFEKYGYFDERYKLIEDYSSALKFSRLGIRFNYFNFISFKHRDGGISHGNINGGQNLNRQYDLDILNIMKHEILPYLDLLDEDQKTRFKDIYKATDWQYSYNYDFKNKNRIQRTTFILKNSNMFASDLYNNVKHYIKDQVSGKKIQILLLGILIYTIYSFINSYSLNEFLNIKRLIELLSIFMILGSLLLMICQISKIILNKIIKFVKFIW